MNEKDPYILGTEADELKRLGLQHRIWADAAVNSWKRAGFGPGSQVLDAGCGPGYASTDLAQLLTDSGTVISLDESPSFIEFLKIRAKALALSQIRPVQGDVLSLAHIPQYGKLDGVYCRWVLCWLKNPEVALAQFFAALKPGGKLVIHDYFNWRAMGMAPRSQAVEKMVLAAVDSFVEHDGDVDVGARLLKLLRQHRFSVQHFEVHQRVARGGGLDTTLQWPLTWWRTYGPKLEKMAKLSSEDLAQALADLAELEKNPDQFFFCPPLFEFIAVKN